MKKKISLEGRTGNLDPGNHKERQTSHPRQHSGLQFTPSIDGFEITVAQSLILSCRHLVSSSLCVVISYDYNIVFHWLLEPNMFQTLSIPLNANHWQKCPKRFSKEKVSTMPYEIHQKTHSFLLSFFFFFFCCLLKNDHLLALQVLNLFCIFHLLAVHFNFFSLHCFFHVINFFCHKEKRK